MNRIIFFLSVLFASAVNSFADDRFYVVMKDGTAQGFNTNDVDSMTFNTPANKVGELTYDSLQKCLVDGDGVVGVYKKGKSSFNIYYTNGIYIEISKRQYSDGERCVCALGRYKPIEKAVFIEYCIYSRFDNEGNLEQISYRDMLYIIKKEVDKDSEGQAITKISVVDEEFVALYKESKPGLEKVIKKYNSTKWFFDMLFKDVE